MKESEEEIKQLEQTKEKSYLNMKIWKNTWKN